MEERGSGGFVVDGEEPQLRSIIARSSSSQPLLESAPYAHCMVAAAIGDKSRNATPDQKVEKMAYKHDVGAMMAVREKVVPIAVAKHEPFLPAGIHHDGCGEHVKSSVLGDVGRLFHRKDEAESASSKKADSSSKEDGEEHEKEGKKKKKKKKRSSWLPDPDKRWPIQGFY